MERGEHSGGTSERQKDTADPRSSGCQSYSLGLCLKKSLSREPSYMQSEKLSSFCTACFCHLWQTLFLFTNIFDLLSVHMEDEISRNPKNIAMDSALVSDRRAEVYWAEACKCLCAILQTPLCSIEPGAHVFQMVQLQEDGALSAWISELLQCPHSMSRETPVGHFDLQQILNEK